MGELNQFCKEKCNIISEDGCVSKAGDADELYICINVCKASNVEKSCLGNKGCRGKQCKQCKEFGSQRYMTSCPLWVKDSNSDAMVAGGHQLQETALPKPHDSSTATA